MNTNTALAAAAAGAVAAAAVWAIVYQQFARLARRCRAALERAGFWTEAWVRDTRHLLCVCDEQERQIADLHAQISQLQQARKPTTGRARKQKEHLNGTAPEPGRRGRSG